MEYAKVCTPICHWLEYAGQQQAPSNWWRNFAEDPKVKRVDFRPEPHKLAVTGPKAKTSRAPPDPPSAHTTQTDDTHAAALPRF